MNGITFENYHSYDDFGLILSSKVIGFPSVKKKTIDVPGADGELDLTDFFGQTRFQNRKLTFNFSFTGTNQIAVYSDFKNSVHGKKCKIIIDDDPNYYYFGRVSVGNYQWNKGIGIVKVECDCDPWKLKQSETTITKTINASGTIVLSNLRKPVSPKITTSTEMTISFDGASYTLSAGSDWIIPELILSSGNTLITITGSGTITFKYREGSF